MPVLVEMGWGGRVTEPWNIRWTDVTPRVDMVQGVTISRGASDERSETQPGTASLRLANQDGAITPGNPGSPFYPYVRRNTPIRVSATVLLTRTGSAPWPLIRLADDFRDDRIDPVLWPNSYGGVSESDGYARIPCAPGAYAAFQSGRQWTLTGGHFRVRLTKLPEARGSSSAALSIMANSTVDGTRAGFTYNPVAGTMRLVSEVGYYDAAATVLTYSPAEHLWVRIRQAAASLYWETSADGVEWVIRRTLATPAWVGAGPVVMEMVATRTGGTADEVLLGPVNTFIYPRFYGVVNEFPIEWEGLLSSVSISATDLFKRLNRWPVLRSMASEEILRAGPQAFYPLTEETGATSAGNVGPVSRPALAIVQAGTGGTLELGTAAGPAATGEQVPVFTPASATAGKYLSVDIGAGRIPKTEPGQGGGSGDLLFECWFNASATGRVFLSWLDGAPDAFESSIRFSLESGTGRLRLDERFGGNSAGATAATPNLADGAWHHLVYSAAPSVQRAWVDNIFYTLACTPKSNLRVLQVGSYRGTALWAGSISHVAIYADTGAGPYGSDLALHYAAGVTGYEGETADARITRLASYAGITSVTIGGLLHDAMAGQGPGGSSVMARMREVESTESARLFAERDYFGLSYQSRDLRYNPDPIGEVFTIDYADLETGEVKLADDDQKLINRVEGSRPGGAVQVVADATSIEQNGVYEQGLSLIKVSDDAVLNAASWVVSRYSDPAPELREVPIEAATMPTYLDILDGDISGYFTVYGLPAQSSASAIRCTIEGYTETLKEQSHQIVFHTSASNRDSIWVLDDSVYSILGYTTRLAY